MRTQKHWDCLEKSKKNLYRNSIDAFCLHLCICEYLCSILCVCVCVSAAIKLQFWTEACIAFWHHLAKMKLKYYKCKAI